MKEKKILSSVARLHFDRSIDGVDIQSKDLRGAIAGLYPDKVLLHQHEKDGTVRYNYPLVQYKNIQKECLIVGIERGAKVVYKLDLIGKPILLSNEIYTIVKKDHSVRILSFGITEANVSYFFLTPWLALNEENYEKYKNLESCKEKEELLKRILIGNIISVAKGVGYVIPEEIVVSCLKVFPTRTPVKLKGVGMTAFLGEFTVNFELPDYFGLGKSVSRGFGTIKRIE